MPKNILIFSDGTGQVGGMKPDQRLSNVYKLYRAARPGPSSPIKPSEQVCFYDAGLGAGEVGGLTFQRVRNVLSAAVGTGIDENVIDCYEKIISYYEPGDRILVFGFSLCDTLDTFSSLFPNLQGSCSYCITHRRLKVYLKASIA